MKAMKELGEQYDKELNIFAERIVRHKRCSKEDALESIGDYVRAVIMVRSEQHIKRSEVGKICSNCGGTGQDDSQYYGLCELCGGSGKGRVCSVCGGTGQDDPPPGKYHGLCERCHGSGKEGQ